MVADTGEMSPVSCEVAPGVTACALIAEGMGTSMLAPCCAAKLL